MPDFAAIEATLLGVVEALRHEYDVPLKQRGLCMDRPEISVLRSRPDSYTSEMRIYVKRLRDSQIVDCLEFFVFEKGRLVLTNEELRVWLVEQIADLAETEP